MPPTIPTTLGALATAEAALQHLLAVTFDQAGGAKVRYHVVKLARLVAAETAHFYEERNKLITQYGTGEPKTILPTSPQLPAFTADLKTLADVPVTLAWGPLTSAMLDPYPAVLGADLLALGPLYELDPLPAAKE